MEQCSQNDCELDAIYKYTWPGKDEEYCCEVHRVALLRIAGSIGLHLQIQPITTFPIQVAIAMGKQLSEIPPEGDVLLWIKQMVEEMNGYSRGLYKFEQFFQGSKDGMRIDMILHCPKCHTQHIDKPDEKTPWSGSWTNPPHRTHLCSECGHEWRPALVCTNGVESL